MAQTPPIVRTPDQQHLLFLFLPIKAKAKQRALHAAQSLAGHAAQSTGSGPDTRASTGVHFAWFYHLEAGTTPPGMKVPTFTTASIIDPKDPTKNIPKDLLAVFAIYDRDFAPYISAFTTQPPIVEALTGLLHALDETGIVDPSDKTSAASILAAGITNATDAFNCLLMRYNFGDPVIPGRSVQTEADRFLFSSTFPGLTVGKILSNYPDADATWPWPPQPMNFPKAVAPICPPK